MNTPGYSINVDPAMAANQHYKKCHFSKKECKKLMAHVGQDDNILKYKHKLKLNVFQQLKVIGI